MSMRAYQGPCTTCGHDHTASNLRDPDRVYVFTLHHQRPMKGSQAGPVVCVFDHPPSGEEIVRSIAGNGPFNSRAMLLAMTDELLALPHPLMIKQTLDQAESEGKWPSMCCPSSDREMMMAIQRTFVSKP